MRKLFFVCSLLLTGLTSYATGLDSVQYKINGRIQTDGAVFMGEDFQPLGNGVGFRRVRLEANGSINSRLSARIELDFASGEFELQDCFIAYDFPRKLRLQVGNMKESFSVATLTSSMNLWFLEKAMVVSALSPEVQSGIQASWNGKNLLAMGGVHFRTIAGKSEKESNDEKNKMGEDDGISYTARGVWMPLSANRDYGLHLGAAASYRTPKTSDGGDMPNSVRYRVTSVSTINKIKFIDSGVIEHVHHNWLFGAELLAFYDSFRFQGEYMMNQVHRTGDLSTERFNGYYAQAGYLFFNGRQTYNRSRGVFSNPSGLQKWGGLEVVARWERMDMNSHDVKGGLANALTLGLNYYMNRYFKAQLNYSHIDHDEYANANGEAAVGRGQDGQLVYNPAGIDKSQGSGNAYGVLSLRLQLQF